MDHKTLVLLVLLRNGAVSINELRRLVDLDTIKNGHRLPEEESRTIFIDSDNPNKPKDFDNSEFTQYLIKLKELWSN